MSSDVVIRVENLGKRYRLGQHAAYSTLRESVRRWAVSPLRRLLRRHRVAASRRKDGFLWALKDVSFDVRSGEVVGIIGRNGAGKTTLLKIITRITRPTAGRAEIRGRTGCLLEVGTGFHPELTGRENVFLNGAILGMRRAEIKRKFDRIVDFSGVEPFLDTPVKRYSSGMRVRLAFAVAAHLEPEILLVDEVLAVGDAEFQKKCLGKMSDVAKGGRTVLFVSHNMAAVQNLCTKGLLLHEGRVIFQGDMSRTIDTYLSTTFHAEPGFAELADHPGRPPEMTPIIRSVGLRDGLGQAYRRVITTGEDVVFEIGYDTGPHAVDYAVVAISTTLGERVLTLSTHQCPGFDQTLRGRGTILCRVSRLPLGEGEYSVAVAMGSRRPIRNLDYVEDALRFHVELHDFFGTGATLLRGQGYYAQRSDWEVAPAGDVSGPASD